MSQKHFNINTLIAIVVITAVVAGWGIIHFDAMDKPYEHTNPTVGGTCTYEGLECPNALAIHQQDSFLISEIQYEVDSLYDVIDSLRTQLAGCELKDHSRLVANTK